MCAAKAEDGVGPEKRVTEDQTPIRRVVEAAFQPLGGGVEWAVGGCR